MYNHWSFHSAGQVGTWVFRWNGITEDFQEECYNVPDIVQDEFQAIQGQIAWVARRGQDTSNHLAFVEHELKSLWVQVRLEQKYLRHLIKELSGTWYFSKFFFIVFHHFLCCSIPFHSFLSVSLLKKRQYACY